MSNDKAVQVRCCDGSLLYFDTVSAALAYAKEQTSEEVEKISFSLGKERIILDPMPEDDGSTLWYLRDHPLFLKSG